MKKYLSSVFVIFLITLTCIGVSADEITANDNTSSWFSFDLKDHIYKFVFGVAEDIVGEAEGLFNQFSNTFLATESGIANLGFVDSIYSITFYIGLSLLIIIVVWQITKGMFAFAGIEVEEAWKIGVKAVIFGFLILNARSISFAVLGIFGKVISFISESGTEMIVTALTDNIFGFIKSIIIGSAAIFDPLRVVLGLVILWKLCMLFFKFCKRLILVAFLVMLSPLAFACGVSQATKGWLVGWTKLFTSNLIIQIVQVLSVLALNIFLLHYNWADNIFFTFIIITSMLSIIEHLEEIFRDISAAVGIGRDGGNLLNSASYAARSAQTIVNVVKSISK